MRNELRAVIVDRLRYILECRQPDLTPGEGNTIKLFAQCLILACLEDIEAHLERIANATEPG